MILCTLERDRSNPSRGNLNNTVFNGKTSNAFAKQSLLLGY